MLLWNPDKRESLGQSTRMKVLTMGLKKTMISMQKVQSFMTIVFLLLCTACVSGISDSQSSQEDWNHVPVEILDDHELFKTMPMFRTKTDSDTEIRNYALGYDFGECFSKAGAKKNGDFVNENDFINCSSSRIVCNNLFYIKEDTILEYAPTGRCPLDERVLPQKTGPLSQLP